MVQYGSEYNEDDFEMYFTNDHYNVVAINMGKIVAFGCVLRIEDFYMMTYTWNDNTYSGKKGYVLGIRYMLDRFKDIIFEENGDRILKRNTR